MNVVGRVGNLITQGVSSVATPFHPFGGAVDIIVVKQHDGTFRSTPWYVRFGKFQGVLKGAEKLVQIEVNGVQANFNMHLDNSGEAYFFNDGKKASDYFKKPLNNLGDAEHSSMDQSSKENDYASQYSADNDEVEVRDERLTLGMSRLERLESDCERIFFEFPDEKSSEGSPKISEYDSSTHNNNSDSEQVVKSQNSDSDEVILVSVDGHILTAPMSPSEGKAENLEPSTSQSHLHPAKETADCSSGCDASGYEASTGNICEGNDGTLSSSHHLETRECDGEDPCNTLGTNVSADHAKKLRSFQSHDVFKSCLELQNLSVQPRIVDPENGVSSRKIPKDADDLKENSCSSSLINKTEEEILEISRNNDELAPHDSGNPTSVSSAQGVDAGHERNSPDMDQYCSDGMPNHKPLEQMEVDPVVERMHSGEKSPYDKHMQNDCNESHADSPVEELDFDKLSKFEISLCGDLLYAGMGLSAAQSAFDANRMSVEEFKHSVSSTVKKENLIVRLNGQYIPWNKARHIIFGMEACGLDLSIAPEDVIPVEEEAQISKEDDSAPSRGWSIWTIPFWRRAKALEQRSHNSSEEIRADSDSGSKNQHTVTNPTNPIPVTESPRKQILRTNVPTSDQIASLNLQDGQNMVTFVFSSKVLGSQTVDAHIYLWKWNSRIVISDVDGTITKSDVLGQFMPLVGKDWTHSGIAHLFGAIEENGYQFVFLSARAIVQSYITKNFLFNLKQDGKSLPTGPVVISPDGLFPSLYREVIRRAPHEFKIACLEDIKALFPHDYHPFYAGFGNRDTDELSYRRIGIPKGKIFIINPKGEVAINHHIDVKSYSSLHTLVNDIFPPTSLIEQEDYNSWNFWKMPMPDL